MTDKAKEVRRNIINALTNLDYNKPISSVLDDYFDPYITELETQINEMKNCFNCTKGTFENRNCCVRCGCVNRDKWEMKKDD